MVLVMSLRKVVVKSKLKNGTKKKWKPLTDLIIESNFGIDLYADYYPSFFNY